MRKKFCLVAVLFLFIPSAVLGQERLTTDSTIT